jgi:hypothetical protein
MSRTGYNGGSVSTDPDELTLANVKDGTIKYKNLRKNKLQLLCGTLLNHIKDLELELRLKKAKVEKAKVEHRGELKELKKTVGDLELELRLEKAMAPHNVSTPNKTFELRAELKELKETVKDLELELRLEKAEPLHNVELRAELKELKEAIFVHKNGTNATSNGEDDVKGVVNTADVTSVEEGDVNATFSKAKWAKLAKLVKLAKSTEQWCLSPYVPLSQEAKDKQRKVCPVNLRGRSARPTTAATSTPRSASWPTTARGRSPRPLAHCGTYESRLRVPGASHRENPPASRGTAATMPSTLSSSRQSTVLRSSRQGSRQRR